MDSLLKSSYDTSHALIVGIDEYANSAPLGFAKSDASAIADCLIQTLGFHEENVTQLQDADATKKNILDAYMAFTANTVLSNDRVFFFYAGHGHTVTGRRGEVGYLVPHDGSVELLGTLLRWDDLTRNADLIAAKHVLYIMDACYGGLAITRSMQPGATRFLHDMLRRTARQVITAGKANEAVADEGGPRPNHSVFTGHLLDALEGKAATQDGILTANSVMNYVYQMVGSDSESHQTPHYGYLYGDGDFIIKLPDESSQSLGDSKGQTENDTLISVHSVFGQSFVESNSDKAKRLLSDE